MNVIEENRFSSGFARLRDLLPKPKAILAVSAHWYVRGTYLTGNVQPKTIHDFSGFPKALYEIEYRSPGSVDLAERVRTMIGSSGAELRTDWGLDHGTWSVLRWMYPEADIPVVQLSIDQRLEPMRHLELARSLGVLRDQGVLLMGSGNVTHNLADVMTRMQTGDSSPAPWAKRFDEAVKKATIDRDARVLAALPSTDDGKMSHPSHDHFLPYLYAFAATTNDDIVRFTSEELDLGSISMRNAVWG